MMEFEQDNALQAQLTVEPCLIRLRNQIATLRDEKPQSLEKILEQTMHDVQQMQRTNVLLHAVRSLRWLVLT